MAMEKLRVTLVKSPINRKEIQKKNLVTLGLRKLNQSVEVENIPSVQGMLSKVSHLVKVENI